MMRRLNEAVFAGRLWRANGAGAVRRWWRERNCTHLHVLSRTPAVVYLHWGREDRAIHEELAAEPLIVLYLFPWCTRPGDIAGIAARARERLRDFPGHRIVFLCNEAFTVEPLRAAGVEAVFCNQNGFINENFFRPLEHIPKKYDAVYSASLAPYKRHHLAAGIQSLQMLSYVYGGTHSDTYGAEVRRLLAHAHWAKDSRSDREKFTTGQMVECYNRARVGLILSEREGSVFASVEYLLCGLPVVSTHSVGGRDSFWDERFVIVCESTPEAVARSVGELKRRNMDPNLVRAATLDRMKQHRARLRETLAPVLNDFECPWPPGSHGPFTFFNLRRLGETLRRNLPDPLP